MDQYNWFMKLINGFNVFLLVITAVIGYEIFKAAEKSVIIILSIIVGFILTLVIELSLIIRLTTKKNPRITEDQISSLFGKKTIIAKKKKNTNQAANAWKKQLYFEMAAIDNIENETDEKSVSFGLARSIIRI